MKIFRGLPFFLAAMTFFSACTTVKRFKSARYQGEDKTLAGMSLFETRLETGDRELDRKYLWDLSASAQTQLIQILDKRYPGNEGFKAALNQSFIQDEIVSDLTRAELQMVFTVTRQRETTAFGTRRGSFSPADRIEYLKFSLQLPEHASLHFLSWNRFETEYGDLEIADVSFSRDMETELQAGWDRIEGSMKTGTGRKEVQPVRSRYLKLNGLMTSDRLTVEEEGTREADLAGNVTAEVALQFDGFPERIAIPVCSDPENGVTEITGLEWKDLQIPRMEEAPDTLFALLEYEYVYRHVRSGWKTFPEWDDRVSYYRGKVSKEVPVLFKSSYAPDIYGIGTNAGSQNPSAFEKIIRVRTLRGEEFPLRFLGIGDARRFYDWLAMKTGSAETDPTAPLVIGNQALVLGEVPLTRKVLGEIPGLGIFPVYH